MTDFSVHNPSLNGTDYVQKFTDFLADLTNELTDRSFSSGGNLLEVRDTLNVGKHIRARNSEGGFDMHLDGEATNLTIKYTDENAVKLENLVKFEFNGDTTFFYQDEDMARISSEGLEVSTPAVATRSYKLFDNLFGGIAIENYANAGYWKQTDASGASIKTLIETRHNQGVRIFYNDVKKVETIAEGFFISDGVLKKEAHTIAELNALTVADYNQCDSWCSDLVGGSGPVYCNGTIWIAYSTGVEIA